MLAVAEALPEHRLQRLDSVPAENKTEAVSEEGGAQNNQIRPIILGNQCTGIVYDLEGLSFPIW